MEESIPDFQSTVSISWSEDWNQLVFKGPKQNTIFPWMNSLTLVSFFVIVKPRILKLCQKLKNIIFKRSEHLFFNLKVVLKSFPKRFHITKFWFKQFSRLCLAFQGNDFNLATTQTSKKKKKRKEKCHFQTLRTFVFELKVDFS